MEMPETKPTITKRSVWNAGRTVGAKGVLQLVPGIAAISEDVAQPREVVQDFCEHHRRAVSILNVGGVDHSMNQIALGVGEDVAFAALIVSPGWWCYPITTTSGAAILYLHGGAYVLSSALAYRHLAGQIAERSEVAVFVADYALAHQFRISIKR